MPNAWNGKKTMKASLNHDFKKFQLKTPLHTKTKIPDSTKYWQSCSIILIADADAK